MNNLLCCVVTVSKFAFTISSFIFPLNENLMENMLREIFALLFLAKNSNA